MENEIKKVIGGIVSNIKETNIRQAQELLETDAAKKALESIEKYDLEGFYFSLIYPIEEIIDGLIQSEYESHHLKFLIKHSQFVERHFEVIISNKEGFACCADKSRTINNMLLKFLLTGEEILWDYDAKYTFHMPRTVFTNHIEIWEFFEAIYFLYYGNSEKYISLMNGSRGYRDDK